MSCLKHMSIIQRRCIQRVSTRRVIAYPSAPRDITSRASTQKDHHPSCSKKHSTKVPVYVGRTTVTNTPVFKALARESRTVSGLTPPHLSASHERGIEGKRRRLSEVRPYPI